MTQSQGTGAFPERKTNKTGRTINPCTDGWPCRGDQLIEAAFEEEGSPPGGGGGAGTWRTARRGVESAL